MCRSTFSTTTIASSTTMPIARTRPKSDSVLSEKPNAEHHREGADQRHRHGDERDDRRAPGLQEDHHDDDDEQDRLEQRLDDRANRLAHEDRRVVDDAVVHALGKRLLQPLHRLRAPGSTPRARWCPAAGRRRSRPPAGCRAGCAARTVFAPSSTRPTSRTRVICPSGVARTTMSANSSSVVSRPRALIDSWKVGVARAPAARRARRPPPGRSARGSRGRRRSPSAAATRGDSDRARRACCTRRAPKTCALPTPAMRVELVLDPQVARSSRGSSMS